MTKETEETKVVQVQVWNPVRTGPQSIDMVVKFPWLDEPVPFSARSDDSEAHGRELYEKAAKGEFGPVAEA